nr:WAS/WASL-interacting protein family member 3-like [Penaeus vannamei]
MVTSPRAGDSARESGSGSIWGPNVSFPQRHEKGNILPNTMCTTSQHDRPLRAFQSAATVPAQPPPPPPPPPRRYSPPPTPLPRPPPLIPTSPPANSAIFSTPLPLLPTLPPLFPCCYSHLLATSNSAAATPTSATSAAAATPNSDNSAASTPPPPTPPLLPPPKLRRRRYSNSSTPPPTRRHRRYSTSAAATPPLRYSHLRELQQLRRRATHLHRQLRCRRPPPHRRYGYGPLRIFPSFTPTEDHFPWHATLGRYTACHGSFLSCPSDNEDLLVEFDIQLPFLQDIWPNFTGYSSP